jgi:protein phosphatase
VRGLGCIRRRVLHARQQSKGQAGDGREAGGGGHHLTTAEKPPGLQAPLAEPWFDAATLTDVGTEREHNEDRSGVLALGPTSVVVAVADGVSSAEAGEMAATKAVDVTLRAYQEQPADVPAGKRLARAAQQANIEIHDMAMIVPELRGMTTTLTALALDGGNLYIAHVGDSRLYRVRDRSITQLTKDHTVVGEWVRLGLVSEGRARHHPDRSRLTRSLGRDLIPSLDRISTRVYSGDVLVVCSDGLYNVLDDGEMREMVQGGGAQAACSALVEAANARGTPDNLTAAVVRVLGPLPRPPEKKGPRAWIERLLAGRANR